ncbi:MAG: ThiF family adenylyltransferase [Verrucomicrobiota bacterium]
MIAGFDQSKLAAAHILLIGAGGIGGEVGEGLCRKGVGRLSLFDHDLVESSNLNRQHFFERDIYQNKATSLARNLAPHCHAGTTLEGNPVSFEDGLALETNMAADVVVCGVDNNAARVAASDHYRNLGVPVIFIAVDFLAECGHVFVQESRPTTACFLCAFPSSLVPKKAPCFVPSSKDILKVTAGFGLYAIDSLLMDRKRNWNFRRIHLAGFAPEVIETITQNPNCPRCGKKAQQGSSNVITY